MYLYFREPPVNYEVDVGRAMQDLRDCSCLSATESKGDLKFFYAYGETGKPMIAVDVEQSFCCIFFSTMMISFLKFLKENAKFNNSTILN